MSISVISNLVAFVNYAPHQIGISLAIFSDNEKCRRYIFLLQDI